MLLDCTKDILGGAEGTESEMRGVRCMSYEKNGVKINYAKDKVRK
jgi:hypothetical protein